MNRIQKFPVFILFALFAVASCGKDDPLEHLPGTWALETVDVDGQSGTGVGTITFNEDLTGTMAITFTGGGIQVTRGGSFTYEATKDEIIFDGVTVNFTWERKTNRSDEQVFEFVEDVLGADYNVTLGFGK